MEKSIRQKNTESLFDDGDALIGLAVASFQQAAKAAVAENDRLGIPTHGSVDGNLFEIHCHF